MSGLYEPLRCCDALLDGWVMVGRSVGRSGVQSGVQSVAGKGLSVRGAVVWGLVVDRAVLGPFGRLRRAICRPV